MNFALAVAVAATVFLFAKAAVAEAPVPIEQRLRSQRESELVRENRRLRHRAQRLLRKLGWRELQVRNMHRALRERLQLSGGLTQSFLCIHHFEGAWTAATGNGYHGGLQMDSSFMSTYGGNFYRAWGGAEHWPPFVQLAVGMNAYLSGRGFGPWPNTSRMCGL